MHTSNDGLGTQHFSLKEQQRKRQDDCERDEKRIIGCEKCTIAHTCENARRREENRWETKKCNEIRHELAKATCILLSEFVFVVAIMLRKNAFEGPQSITQIWLCACAYCLCVCLSHSVSLPISACMYAFVYVLLLYFNIEVSRTMRIARSHLTLCIYFVHTHFPSMQCSWNSLI